MKPLIALGQKQTSEVLGNVRFSSKSGHSLARFERPFGANRGPQGYGVAVDTKRCLVTYDWEVNLDGVPIYMSLMDRG